MKKETLNGRIGESARGGETMNFELTESQKEIRTAVADLCERFGNEYWRGCDEKNAYPDEFVKTLSQAGWLAALIPQEYGALDLGCWRRRSFSKRSIAAAAMRWRDMRRCTPWLLS
jgi:alkylation response protein AidB-like acyl-CoA dehydrogenase